jgi:imidazolonepropionase-like amidohydrolase
MATTVSPGLIQGARVFDGLRVQAETSVLVVDGHIAAVGDNLGAPPAAVLVDGVGRTLLPGLIDAHTHVFPGRLEQAVLFGVTTEPTRRRTSRADRCPRRARR